MTAIDPVMFYKTWVQVGSFILPVIPPVTINIDENFATPQPLGNYWQYNYVPGLIQPMVDVNFGVRDVASEVMSSSFLNLFHSRSDDTAHDVAVISGGVTFYDGGDCQQLTGAKANSYSINCAKGELLNFSARFCGTDVISASTPSISAWSSDPPLNYTACTFDSGSFGTHAYRFGLSFSNNLWPDNELDGTRGPSAWHAGVESVGFQCNVKAKFVLPADGSSATLQIRGNAVTRNFVLPRILCNNRRRRSI